MGSTKNFFQKKRGWSLLKDKIIDYYLTPYISKILSTYKPLTMVDCFAGKGKFDDGEDGSPLMIAKHIKYVLGSDTFNNKNISGIFIEKKYFRELKENLDCYQNCTVLEGTFEENVKNILALNSDNNIFMYVDPYGPKSIPFKPFQQIRNNNFVSLEVLINFNTFGFLREGCRLFSYYDKYDEMDKEGEEDYEIDEANNILEMDQIANGLYWHTILSDYKKGRIAMFELEEKFTDRYISKLKNLFKYVINIPIKSKIKNIPKYRLIFGTNHEDGLILMANQMNKSWKGILQQERGGQKVLFEYDFPNLSLYKGFDLEDDILSLVKKYGRKILLKELIIELIQTYGISFSEKEYNNKLKKMDGKKIKIERKPECTKTGKRAASMDYEKYKIIIKLI